MSRTASIIAATIILAGTIATITPSGQTTAESSCMAGFSLVTTDEAATVHPQIPLIDSNSDGLLCRMDLTTSGGVNILFTENAVTKVGGCPDDFTPTLWPRGEDPDRNENGIVCMKVTPGRTVIIDDNAQCKQCPPLLGTKIAFDTNRDGNLEIYKMNSDGTGETRLTNNAADDFVPAWSPDGTQIAFSTNRDGNFEIYKMNADGTNPIRLTNNAADDGQPAWSPDGTQIAFVTTRHGKLEIYKMNSDGTGETRLTNNAADDRFPAWSPDGLQIAFDTERHGNMEIYKMNSDGTGETRLTNNAAVDRDPDWGIEPDSP